MKGIAIMKTIYLISVHQTGSNSNIIHSIDSAYTDKKVALDICDRMAETYQDDPNFISYVTGPIILNMTNKRSDLD